YWLRQRCRVGSLTPSFWKTWAMFRPCARSASAWRSLAMTSSGECRFITRLLAPQGASETLIAPGPGFGEQTNKVQSVPLLAVRTWNLNIRADAAPEEAGIEVPHSVQIQIHQSE